MDTTWFAKQILDFQKSTFDNTFNAVAMFQDHTENVAETLNQQATWAPEEAKRTMDQWTVAFKKGRDDFKKAVDDNFAAARSAFAPATKEG